MDKLASLWKTEITSVMRNKYHANVLQQAALEKDLRTWTSQLTSASVEAFKALGYCAAAKGHKLTCLPVRRSEYLSIDVLALKEPTKSWSFPIAAVELENSPKTDDVAYSLWKVLSVRAPLRVVFCYKDDNDGAAALIRSLRDTVIGSMNAEDRVALDGETVVVVGTRGSVATFPYSFFSWWGLDYNVGQFYRL